MANCFIHFHLKMNNNDNNNKPILIGITGRKFHGKDTLVNRLVQRFGYKKFAFADPLKEACRIIFGFNHEQLYGNKKEEKDVFWNITPRKIFQFVGTDLFRDQAKNIIPNIGEDLWIEVIRKKILDEWKENPNQHIVITDVRFPNEADMIHQMNGIIVRVKRDKMIKRYN